MDEKKLRHDLKAIAANLDMFKELLLDEDFSRSELAEKLQKIITNAENLSISID